MEYVKKWDKNLLRAEVALLAVLAFTATLIFDTPIRGALYWLSDWADRHEGLAAWIQAFGVFAAVLFAGELARRESARQARDQQERLVSSTQAVIAKASMATQELMDGFFLAEASDPFRHPIRMLEVVHGALTPKRIHDLPDYTMVTRAVDVVSELAAILDWCEQNPMVFTRGFFGDRPAAVPETLKGLSNRVIEDCTAFTAYAERWLHWN